jgi:uncharacterized protein (TIGR02147 family)
MAVETAHDNLRPETSAIRPSIFRYHDYREFLKDFIEYKRAGDSKFSLRSVAKKANLTAAYLSMILKGVRSLSPKAFERLFPVLGLNVSERSYLSSLVKLADSKSMKQRFEALERLQLYQGYKQENPKDLEAYKYLSNWYYVAIREMAMLPDFKLDAEWIQSRLGQYVLLNDIQKAIDFLLSQGLIEKRADGKVHVPSPRINCRDGVYQLAMGQFHSEFLQFAIKSIETAPAHQREFKGYTFPVSQGKIEQLREIFKEAISKIKELESQDTQATDVYHVTLAAFPVTKVNDVEEVEE